MKKIAGDVKLLYKYLLDLSINLLLVYACFTVCRIVFLLVNYSFFSADITFSQLVEIFKGGLLFDTSAILYLNVLYIFLFLFPLHYKEGRLFQKILKILFVFINSLAIIANLADTVYFQYTNRRTTFSVFREFGKEGNLAKIIGVELLNHWYLVVLAIILIYSLYKFYRKPVYANSSKLWFYYSSRITLLLIILPFCIFGMRGGIGSAVRPITISNANQYVDRPVETAIVLNTPFAIIRTIGKKAFVVPDYFKDERSMEMVYTPIHVPADSSKFRPLNVVVLIMESFGKEYIGSLNGETYKSYTPFVDSLVANSLTFEYSFANGRKSIDGMPSILSGIPMFVEPFFLTPASLNKVSGIGGELKKKGYYTAFFHGAENGSMGFEAYARTSGFTDYFGRTEYNNDKDFDGTWAIWDEEFFQFFAGKLSGFKQPFAAAIFSASSHHPFVIPERYKNTFVEGSLPIHKCIRYTDYALKRFFEKASKEPWFENTLFVITADHTNQTEHPEYQTDYGYFSVPILFYHPGSDLKGHIQGIAQQTDIMPTVLGYLGYDRPYLSFGCDLTSTNPADTYAVNYTNGIYQYLKGNYLLQFDGKKTVAFYDFITDPYLKINLVGGSVVHSEMEEELKAIIQQYMMRMNNDRLVVE